MGDPRLEMDGPEPDEAEEGRTWLAGATMEAYVMFRDSDLGPCSRPAHYKSMFGYSLIGYWVDEVADAHVEPDCE